MWAGRLRPAAEGGYIQAQATWRTKSISLHREKKTGMEAPVRMGREHISHLLAASNNEPAGSGSV